MTARLALTPEARRDMLEAYEWYERCGRGLGDKLLDRVDAALEMIRRSPELCAKVHEEYRRVLVRQFPYSVYYEHEDETVTVYAILHTSRDPKRWLERLP